MPRFFSVALLLLAGLSMLATSAAAQSTNHWVSATQPASTRAATRAATTGATTHAATHPQTPPSRVVWPADLVQPSDVATEAEQVDIDLHKIKGDLSNDPVTVLLDAQVPALTSEINARVQENSRLLSSSPSLQNLRSQHRAWSAYGASINDWKHQSAKRRDELDGDTDRLNSMAFRWQKTLDYTDQRQAAIKGPPNRNLLQIQQHIQATLTAIDRTIDQVKNARNHLIGLLRQEDELGAQVLAEKTSVDDAIANAVDRLLSRESVPIWTVLLHWRANNPNMVSESQNSFWTQVKGLDAYVHRELPRFVLQGFILLALIAALQFGRRRVQEALTHDPLLADATPVFRFPVLTAIVLTFLISIWIYPQAPRLLWAIVGAAALIPTVLILRRLVERRLLPILDAMVAFYFVDQLRSVVASQIVLSRLLLLLEALAACLFLLSFLGSTRAAPTDHQTGGDRLWRIIRFGARLALLLFAAACIADAIGYVSLSMLLGDATLSSAYLAIILYAAIRLIDGLVLIALRARPLAYLSLVRRNEPLLRARTTTLLHWVAVLFWLYATMEMFWLWNPFYSGVRNVLDASIPLGHLTFTLHNVLVFVITVWAAFLISRLIRFALEEDIYARFGMATGTTYAISRMLHYVILVAGFYLAVGAAGVPTTHFTILAGAFGVGLGFGLQNIVNNFVSGLILLFERPIKVGDLVQIGDDLGVVSHIGIRASIIRTADSSEIIVPNGNLISATVTNWTLSNRQRGIEIPVSVAAAGNDPKHIIDLLQRAAATNSLITSAPPPHAYFTQFSGDTFQFKLRAWTNQAENWAEVCSNLALAVNAALAKENIAIK